MNSFLYFFRLNVKLFTAASFPSMIFKPSNSPTSNDSFAILAMLSDVSELLVALELVTYSGPPERSKWFPSGANQLIH